MIIRKVRTQRPTQRLFTKNNHMIQAFTTNRTDHAFDVSALPRRPRSTEDFFDIHDGDLIAELVAIDPVSISQQIAWRGIERKSFQHLVGSPFRRGMSCDVEVNNAATIMSEDNKDEEDFKPNSVGTVKNSTEASWET